MPSDKLAHAAAGITLSEAAGVRYLHFGTEWVQGAMRIAQPYRLELEYQQQMMVPLLLLPRPRRILQLGLGAAARPLQVRQRVIAHDRQPAILLG